MAKRIRLDGGLSQDISRENSVFEMQLTEAWHPDLPSSSVGDDMHAAKKNHAPVAKNDTNGKDKVVEQGSGVKGDPKASGNVLDNDTDKDGDALKVQNDGTFEGKYGTLKLSANGRWTYTLDNNDKDTEALKSGQTGLEKFKYTVTDGHGGKDNATLQINIAGTDDLTPPKITIDPITKDNIVNRDESNSSVKITGSVTGAVRNGDTVTIVVNGNELTGKVHSGHFSIVVDGTQIALDEDHKIEASVTTGGEGHEVTASATKSYAVDLTPPTATITVNKIAGDNVVNAVEANGTVTITGAVGGDVQNDDVVTVAIDGHSYTGAVSDGKFSVAVEGSVLAGATEKTIDVSVTTHDLAGNAGTASAQADYTVNTNVPTVSIALMPIAEDGIINASEASPSAITIFGTVGGDANTGDTVTLVVNGENFTGLVENHSFAIAVKTSNLLLDPDNTIEASVSSSDSAGNVGSAQVSEHYTVDTVVPSGALTLDAVTGDGIINAEEASGNITLTGLLTGDIGDNPTVTIAINNTVYTVQYTTVEEHSASFSVTVAASDLIADSDHTIDASVTLTDAAQNSRVVTTTAAYVVDTTPPNATITIDNIATMGGTDTVTRAMLEAGVVISGTVTGEVSNGDIVNIMLGSHRYSATVQNGTFSVGVSAEDLIENSDLDPQSLRIVTASIATRDDAGNGVTVHTQHAYDVDIHYDLNSGIAPGDGFMVTNTLGGASVLGVAAFVGDVNGDGFDDIMSSVYMTETTASGVFGSAAPTDIDVQSSLFGVGGISGSISISSAGDVNGDGLDDMIVSAIDEDGVYVVVGSTTIGQVNAHSMTSGQGSTLTYYLEGSTGYSVSSAGDINGDGYDDLLIGIPNLTSYNDGRAYVVFGAPVLDSTSIELVGVQPPAGIKIKGSNANAAGYSVSSAGDMNGDGFDDLVIGAPSFRSGTGDVYVVYGGSNMSEINLDTLGSTQGFIIHGSSGLHNGYSVSGAGDVNGDGYDDIVVSVESSNGGFYVVAGGAGLSSFDLNNDVDHRIMFKLIGPNNGGMVGYSVSGSGDINGDGYGDFVVSALSDPTGGTNAGSTQIYYGSASGPLAGPKVIGAAGTSLGWTVSSVGDVNGDGFADIVMGMRETGSSHGATAVIYGGLFKHQTLGQVMIGTTDAEILIGNAGADNIFGKGGADVLRGGNGNDIIGVTGTDFRLIDGGGGYDELRLEGTSDSFDFSTMGTSRLKSIEAIDLTASGNQNITTSKLDVLNMSDDRSNGMTTLMVDGTGGDSVSVYDTGWVSAGSVTPDGNTYNIFTNGHARLLVDSDISLVM